MNTKIILSIVIIITAIIIFNFSGLGQPSFTDLKRQVGQTASLYPKPKSITLNLIDDSKQSVDLTTIAKHKWLLLYFGYTSCPDVCPIDLATINQTTAMMKQKDKLKIIFISVDPQRDIGNLTNFVNKFNTNFLGLSATKTQLAKLTQSLGVYHEIVQVQKRATMDHSKMDHSKMNNYLVDHTASYLLLNPKHQLVALLTNPHQAQKMAKALDLIINSQ